MDRGGAARLGRWAVFAQALALGQGAGCTARAVMYAQNAPTRGDAGGVITPQQCQSIDHSQGACAPTGSFCQGQRSDCIGGPGHARCGMTEWRCNCVGQGDGSARWACQRHQQPAGPQPPPELGA